MLYGGISEVALVTTRKCISSAHTRCFSRRQSNTPSKTPVKVHFCPCMSSCCATKRSCELYRRHGWNAIMSARWPRAASNTVRFGFARNASRWERSCSESGSNAQRNGVSSGRSASSTCTSATAGLLPMVWWVTGVWSKKEGVREAIQCELPLVIISGFSSTMVTCETRQLLQGDATISGFGLSGARAGTQKYCPCLAYRAPGGLNSA
jgi:hypothetical protein